MDTKEISRLERKIQRIKEELMTIQDMRPGRLSQQAHDPGKQRLYWQLSYTHRMKSRSEYVRPEWLARVRTQVKAFRRFKELTQEWVDLALEYAKLQDKLDSEK